jgi:hypothetical protein
MWRDASGARIVTGAAVLLGVTGIAIGVGGLYLTLTSSDAHERAIEERGETVHCNPGGLPIEGADDRFHVATIDTESGAVEHHHVG